MRKKWLAAGIGFGVGAALLVAGGLSAMANASGFETYKAALKQTTEAASLTAQASLTVVDNGTEVLAGTAAIKLDHQASAGSVRALLSSGGNSQEMNVFCQDGNVIFKSAADDVYRVMEHDASGWAGHGHAHRPPFAAGRGADAILGRIKDMAEVATEADGSKRASLHLSGARIPAPGNAIAGMIASRAGGQGWPHGGKFGGDQIGFPSGFAGNMPKLSGDIRVEAVDLDARIRPDGLLNDQTAEITLSGKDGAGKPHLRVIRLHVDFSGYNATTPDRIDLTGKQTVDVPTAGFRRGWHHGE